MASNIKASSPAPIDDGIYRPGPLKAWKTTDDIPEDYCKRVLQTTPYTFAIDVIHLKAIHVEAYAIIKRDYYEQLGKLGEALDAVCTQLIIPFMAAADLPNYPEYKAQILQGPALTMTNLSTGYKALLGAENMMPIARILTTAVPFVLYRMIFLTATMKGSIEYMFRFWGPVLQWIIDSTAACLENFDRAFFKQIIGQCGVYCQWMYVNPGEKYPHKLFRSLDRLATFATKSTKAYTDFTNNHITDPNEVTRRNAIETGGELAVIKHDYTTITSSITDPSTLTHANEIGLAVLYLRATQPELWKLFEQVVAGTRDRLEQFRADNVLPQGYIERKMHEQEEEEKKWTPPKATEYDAGIEKCVVVQRSLL